MIWRLLALAEQLDDGLLRQVFTHSSWVAERGRSYERLEFLGDSVLSLAVTTELYRRFPDHSEGSLARLRAYIVSRATCAKVATRLGLPEFVRRFGTGHEAVELDQLVSNENILADMTESLIGAVYLTYGLDVVRPAVIEAFAEHISFAERSYVDFKTELQEQLAKNGRSVVYRLVETVGPPHSREFVLEAVVDGVALGRGMGASKKRAEQDAAAEALRELSGAERPKRRRARLRRRRREPCPRRPAPAVRASSRWSRPSRARAAAPPSRRPRVPASDGPTPLAESVPVDEPDGPAPVVEAALHVEPEIPAPAPDAALAADADAQAPAPESKPAPRVVFEMGAATRGDTVLRSYSVDVSDDIEVARPVEPVSGPAADAAVAPGEPAATIEPRDAHEPDDAGDDPDAGQGARPSQTDGGV